MNTRAVLITGLLLFTVVCHPGPITKGLNSNLDIIDFYVSLTPDVQTGVVYGEQKILLRPPENLNQTISFTVGALTVFSVYVNGQNTDFDVIEGQLVLPMALAQRANELVEVTAKYSARPTRGYTKGKSGVFTEYFACDWMICEQENFGDKATVTLELNLPRKMESLGPGKLVQSKRLANGMHQSTWRSDTAYSPFLYAFAFGDFTKVSQKAGDVSLRYFSEVASKETLLELFASTVDMLKFFEDKAGTPFPHKEYNQLYVEGASAQEAVSHSVIGEHWLKPILSNPQEDWVIAHELAHQWWGNGVTCTNISEFWLNEGITTFMVMAWKEHRWGRSVYEQELQAMKERYKLTVDAGADFPLAYTGEYPSLKARRSIQYVKGAIFMDRLRRELGDDAFWAGLRKYTSENMGKAVSSPDLQSVYESVSKRDLSLLFSQWVYGEAK